MLQLLQQLQQHYEQQTPVRAGTAAFKLYELVSPLLIRALLQLLHRLPLLQLVLQLLLQQQLQLVVWDVDSRLGSAAVCFFVLFPLSRGIFLHLLEAGS